jgi:phage gpG-like protein
MPVDISEFEDFEEIIQKAIDRTEDLTPAMETISHRMEEEMKKAIDSRVSPSGEAWEPIKPSTREIRRTTNRGSGRLKGSIRGEAERNAANSSANTAYAEVQNSGNPNNRLFGTNNVKPIPARPFSVIGRDGNLPPVLEEEFAKIVLDYIVENKTQ